MCGGHGTTPPPQGWGVHAPPESTPSDAEYPQVKAHKVTLLVRYTGLRSPYSALQRSRTKRMNAVTKTPKDHISRAAGGDAAAASATLGQVARRSGFARFSNKEWVVLLAALAVAIVGTTAAALSPRSAAAAAPAASTVASTTAHACPATAGVEASAPASPSATSASATTTGSTAATPPAASSTVAAKAVTAVATTKAATPIPALVTIGTLVNFGSYGNAPLQWRVLYADDDELLLLSEYVVSAGAFQSDWEGRDASRYSASEVRAWLQGDFAAKVFSTQQSAALLPHTGGAAGTDRVFLLSTAEVERYLPKTKDRKAAPHAAAGAGQVGFGGEPLSMSGAYASWWLADAASDDFAARVVKPDGKLGSQLVYYADLGVRPAIRVNRDKIAYTLDTQGGS